MNAIKRFLGLYPKSPSWCMTRGHHRDKQGQFPLSSPKNGRKTFCLDCGRAGSR